MCTKNSECRALVKLEPCDRNVDMSLKVLKDVPIFDPKRIEDGVGRNGR